MTEEIQQKLDIAQILVKHLGNIDVSEVITPLQEYISEQLSISSVMQAEPEKCEHINYQMDSDGFDVCDDCGKTLF